MNIINIHVDITVRGISTLWMDMRRHFYSIDRYIYIYSIYYIYSAAPQIAGVCGTITTLAYIHGAALSYANVLSSVAVRSDG